MGEIRGRISLLELSISKLLDFQSAILLKNGFLHRFFSRICQLSWKHLGTPLSVCFWYFHNTILIWNSWWKRYLITLLVSIFYLPIFLIPYKTQQRRTIIWRFWTTRIRKSLKIVFVKFIGKIGFTLVADLASCYCASLKINLSNLELHSQFIKCAEMYSGKVREINCASLHLQAD